MKNTPRTLGVKNVMFMTSGSVNIILIILICIIFLQAV
jgi:hypothetical protein